MIARLRRMFAQPGLAGLAFALGLAALGAPFLDLAGDAGGRGLFAYLFGLWGLLVLLAFLISRAVAGTEPDGDDDV